MSNVENRRLLRRNEGSNNSIKLPDIIDSSRYKVKKYLGESARGSLYLALDLDGNKYILKKIILDNMNSKNNKNSEYNSNKQLEFELSILKYLSKNINT